MSVTATFLLLLLLLFAGYALARTTRNDGAVDAASTAEGAGARGADVLNRLGITLFFPAAILLHAPALHPTRDLIGLVAIPWIVVAVAAAAGLAAVKAGADKGVAACVVCGLGFGNTAFIGYAVVPALVDDAPLAEGGALATAVVYDQLGSFVALSTVGLAVIAAAAGQERPSLFAVVKKVVTFPPFLALVAGVTLMPEEPPGDVRRALEVLAGALLPTMAVAVGLRLRFTIPPHHRLPLFVVLAGKLVVVPAAALGLAVVFGLDSVVRDVAVVEAAMPVMVTVGALLALAGVEADLAAAMVAWSTLGSMITLPLWGRLLS